MTSMNLSYIAILITKSTDYCSVISGISISEAITLQSINLARKGEYYKK